MNINDLHTRQEVKNKMLPYQMIPVSFLEGRIYPATIKNWWLGKSEDENDMLNILFEPKGFPNVLFYYSMEMLFWGYRENDFQCLMDELDMEVQTGVDLSVLNKQHTFYLLMGEHQGHYYIDRLIFDDEMNQMIESSTFIANIEDIVLSGFDYVSQTGVYNSKDVRNSGVIYLRYYNENMPIKKGDYIIEIMEDEFVELVEKHSLLKPNGTYDFEVLKHLYSVEVVFDDDEVVAETLVERSY